MSNLLKDIRAIKSGKKELRSFAVTFFVAFLVFALISWKGTHHGTRAVIFLGIAFVFLLLGLTIPVVLKPIQKAWMTLGLLLGLVISPIILGILFYFVITPIGIILRVTGKRFLDLTFREPVASYWRPYPKKADLKKSYEVQF